MSSTLGVQQWFRGPSALADELSRHAREFGFTFIGDDDDDLVKEECPALPPIPQLIPLGEAARMKRPGASESDGGDSARYGGLFVVNGEEDDDKLLRLFGGGDSDSGVSEVSDQCSGLGLMEGQGDCKVVLKSLPSNVLRSLTSDGRISVARACSDSAVEVSGLLSELVSAVAGRQERCPPHTGIDQQSRDTCVETASRKARHRKSETPRKAVRRRSSSGGGKKRRKRSTSCSTTSSTCSTASSVRRHRHRHRHRHRREEPAPAKPRVNPIFVWVKQDNTRIVEVLCEDYDKRNRIRITKTAHGWRAIPRTERLAATEPAQPAPTTAGSTECGHDEATPDQHLVDEHIDGSIIDQNNTSLVPTTVTYPILMEDESTNHEQTKDKDDNMAESEEEQLAVIVPETIEEEEEEDDDEVEEEEEEEDNLPEESELDESHIVVNEVGSQPCLNSAGDDDVPAGVAQSDVADDLTPTDLSIPKSLETSQNKPVTKLVLPRSLSLSIPPVAPSPTQSEYPAAAPAAHQPKTQHKSMFLESLLSTPRKCHETRRPSFEAAKGLAPLDLGVATARGAGSPTVSCSDERKRRTPTPAAYEPKMKNLKVEDITLKNLLSRHPDATKVASDVDLDITVDKKEDLIEFSRKSRLLELLTAEPAPASSPSPSLDPLTQLKKVLSDPELTVPDPLLVPRDRLQELVASPAREIPRLLALRPDLRLPEALAYPALLRDPDLLVVSLSRLQNLLQRSDRAKEDDFSPATFLEWQRFHGQQTSPSELDPAAAAALNQMLWLPYLSQLEAAALSCGNSQDFLAMLNAVFPASYPASFVPAPPLSPAEYKNQLELQQALALWQEAMAQAQAAANNNNRLTKNNNSKTFANNGRFPQGVKKLNSSSARTSPTAHNNFHSTQQYQQQQRSTNNHGYPTTNQLHQQYSLQRCRQSSSSANHSGVTKIPKTEVTSESVPTSKPNNTRPSVTCKSLLNLLSGPRRQHQQERHSHLLAALGKPTPMPPLVPLPHPIDLSGPGRRPHPPPAAPKLKVKQHLVDPTHTPRLLKSEAVPELEVGSTIAPPHLWHPLFGSQKTSLNSPWRWTTVTVTGE